MCDYVVTMYCVRARVCDSKGPDITREMLTGYIVVLARMKSGDTGQTAVIRSFLV